MRARGPNLAARLRTMPLNIGPLAWKNKSALETDLANFKTALHGLQFVEAFMPAVAVEQVLFMVPTKHYSSHSPLPSHLFLQSPPSLRVFTPAHFAAHAPHYDQEYGGGYRLPVPLQPGRVRATTPVPR
jgi:hypothetical protein